MASCVFGINSSNTTPFLSSIFVTNIGSIQTPLLTKVEYAPTISYTERSNVPRHNDGTANIFDLTPIFFARSTTASGPNCFIIYAVIELIEFAKPNFNVKDNSLKSSPEFFGAQSFSKPHLFLSNTTGTFGISKHGV